MPQHFELRWKDWRWLSSDLEKLIIFLSSPTALGASVCQVSIISLCRWKCYKPIQLGLDNYHGATDELRPGETNDIWTFVTDRAYGRARELNQKATMLIPHGNQPRKLPTYVAAAVRPWQRLQCGLRKPCWLVKNVNSVRNHRDIRCSLHKDKTIFHIQIKKQDITLASNFDKRVNLREYAQILTVCCRHVYGTD